MDNPYQTPNVEPTESTTPRHRSFHLTPGSASPDDATVTVGTFRNAIVFTLFQQISLLMLSAMLLDGGWVFKRVAIASVAHWVMTLIIMIRRGRDIPESDILCVKWGFLPLLLATCIIWLVASAMMF